MLASSSKGSADRNQTPVSIHYGTDLTYGRNRVNQWVQGFGIVDVHPGGAFNLYPVVILNGQAVVSGELYGRRRHRKAA
jgi:hypothetical protein